MGVYKHNLMVKIYLASSIGEAPPTHSFPFKKNGITYYRTSTGVTPSRFAEPPSFLLRKKMSSYASNATLSPLRPASTQNISPLCATYVMKARFSPTPFTPSPPPPLAPSPLLLPPLSPFLLRPQSKLKPSNTSYLHAPHPNSYGQVSSERWNST